MLNVRSRSVTYVNSDLLVTKTFSIIYIRTKLGSEDKTICHTFQNLVLIEKSELSYSDEVDRGNGDKYQIWGL